MAWTETEKYILDQKNKAWWRILWIVMEAKKILPRRHFKEVLVSRRFETRGERVWEEKIVDMG